MLRNKARIEVLEKLARVHGPFARFTPDGNEGNDDEVVVEDALGTVIKDGEDDELKDNAEFDKVKQQADQFKANAARSKVAADQANTSLDAAKTENESLKQQLEVAKNKAEEAGIENIELNEDDYEHDTDKKMVQAINSLNKQIKAKDTRISGLETAKKGWEDDQRKGQAARQTNAAYEELLSDLDGDYGPECRNAAVKAFNELAATGEITKGSPAKATRAMEKCYKDAKAAIEKVKKGKKDTPLNLDPGSGGGDGTPNLSGIEIKDGQSLDDAVKQIASSTSKK